MLKVLLLNCLSVSFARQLYVGMYDSATPYSCPAGPFDAKGYNKTSLYIYDIGADGALTKVSEVAAGLNVSWIAGTEDPVRRYTMNEVCLINGQASGAFRVYGADGKGVKLLNQGLTGGLQPAYMDAPDPKLAPNSTAQLLIAHYTSGNVVEELFLDDPPKTTEGGVVSQGKVGKTATHTVVRVPNVGTGKSGYALVPALALDKIFIYYYEQDSEDSLSDPSSKMPNDQNFLQLPTGFGPRHLAFHKNGHTAFLANEGGSDTPARVSVLDYTYDSDTNKEVSNFKLQLESTVSAIPTSVNSTNMYPAEILVSNDGKYVYVSNRDANPGPKLRDCVSVFKFDGKALSFVSSIPVGHYPRSMAITKEGDFLFVGGQKGGDVRTFSVNKDTGALTAVHTPINYGAHHDPGFVGVF